MSSVGDFYSCFESKDAFFDFLRMHTLAGHMTLFDETLVPDSFVGKSRLDVMQAFVDGRLIVFSGPWRRVLQEAHPAIPERPASREPMKARGRLLRGWITARHGPHVGNREGL